MTLSLLARLVVETRQAQRDYFRCRSSGSAEKHALLERSKLLEKPLDKAAADVLAGADRGLFDDAEARP